MTIENDHDANRHHQSMHSVGALLREARESLGMGLDDVAHGLRIRRAYLQGIENDDYSRLPGKTYVLGFLRSYAEFLGLDGDDVVGRYRRQLDDKALPTPSLHFPLREPQARLPRGAIVLLSVVLAAGAVYGGARWLDDESLHAVDRVAPVPDRLIAETRPTPPPVLVPRNDPSSAFAAVTPQPTETTLSALPPAPEPPASPAAAETPAAAAGIAPAVEPPPGSQAAPQAAPQVASAPPPRAALPAVPPAKPPRPEPGARPELAKPDAARPTSPQPAQAPNQPPPANASTAPATQTAALPAAPARPRDILVVARVDSWIEVRDTDNRPLVSLLLRVGDSYRVPEGANYRLVTGDVRGLEVRVDGVAVRQHGTDDAKPHRTLSLDGERLRAGSGVAD